MSSRVMFAMFAAALLASAPAFADDVRAQTIPQKWVDRYLPEDLPELQYRAYHKELDKARIQASRGRYKLALMTLRKVEKGDPAQIALVRAGALAALGREAEAMPALLDSKVKDAAAVQVQRARLLADEGKIEEALELLRQHIERYPRSIAGHYWLAAMLERAGDIPAAREHYDWFNADPQRFLAKWQGNLEEEFENASDLVLIGKALDRSAALNEQYRDNRSLHDAILSVFVKAYDVIDREYWPAHVAAAEYFIAHNNNQEAQEELALALKANPRDRDAWLLAGNLALEQFNFDGAEEAIANIRQVNPESIGAQILETRSLLKQRRPVQADQMIRKVLARQPRNLEALGLLAATQALRLQEQELAATLKRVEALDADNASAYFEVAEQLGAMRQYPRSAAMYKVAIARAPWWIAPRNGLGLLYTQSGDEFPEPGRGPDDNALTVLEAAHSMDPFNLQTTNYLRLLDNLAKFDRRESPHFIILYDGRTDPILADYFSEYLESIHAEVCADYKHEPAVKTMIEVFPKHDEFSVRTTGSPWIGTVGASTGRVIALVAPRGGRQTMGTYNWAQVLRHEYTHTVTLSATDNRIAHWMTEGLAVVQEKSPLRWEWVPMLYSAVQKKELFTMESLTWGFVRPKRPIDRQLAYAQSFWICQYIQERWGQEKILQMLDAFKNGLTQEEVFPKVLQVSQSQFTSDFFAWTEKQVAGWGYDEKTTSRYNELRKKGEDLIKARQYKEAAEVWEEVARLRPMDPLPHQRLAGIYLTEEAKSPLKAIEQLTVLHKVELKDNRYAKRIARIYRDEQKLDDAAPFALEAVYTDPYDIDAHELLAELHERRNNVQGAAREKAVIEVLKQLRARQQEQDKNPATAPTRGET